MATSRSAFPKIRRRRSRVHGWGVFACEPIAKNKRIVHYAGEKVSHRESLKREARLRHAPVKANIFYLHGFASSPASTKAKFFERHLAELGLTLHCPDLNAPDFETLTITRMMSQIQQAILALPPAPTVLIGSSLGGRLAIEVASRWAKRCASGEGGLLAQHAIDRIVLLAPALDFPQSLGEDALEQWKASGRMEVYHHGEGRPRQVHYGLYEDAVRYDPFASYLDFPILIFHGRRDASVDPLSVEAFARCRPNVTLRMLDDDHQLLASLDEIWRDTAEFLGLEDRT